MYKDPNGKLVFERDERLAGMKDSYPATDIEAVLAEAKTHHAKHREEEAQYLGSSAVHGDVIARQHSFKADSLQTAIEQMREFTQ